MVLASRRFEECRLPDAMARQRGEASPISSAAYMNVRADYLQAKQSLLDEARKHDVRCTFTIDSLNELVRT